MTKPGNYNELWRGAAHIREAFERSGTPTNVPLSTFLHNAGRVIIDNDPALIEAFGEEAVADYERRLEELS